MRVPRSQRSGPTHAHAHTTLTRSRTGQYIPTSVRLSVLLALSRRPPRRRRRAGMRPGRRRSPRGGAPVRQTDCAGARGQGHPPRETDALRVTGGGSGRVPSPPPRPSPPGETESRRAPWGGFGGCPPPQRALRSRPPVERGGAVPMLATRPRTRGALGPTSYLLFLVKKAIVAFFTKKRR